MTRQPFRSYPVRTQASGSAVRVVHSRPTDSSSLLLPVCLVPFGGELFGVYRLLARKRSLETREILPSNWIPRGGRTEIHPLVRLDEILRDPFAPPVRHAEVVLGVRVPLLRGLPIPLRRLGGGACLPDTQNFG